jgi:hypothetical protein
MTDPSPGPPEPSAAHRLSPPPIREFNDRGTLWLLEDPLNLRDLFQILEPDLAADLDFPRARRENRSFVPADLQKQESDVVFLVPWRGRQEREVWVYILLEHQSDHEPLMGLRLYLYMGQLWQAQWREWEDRRAPAEQRRLRPIIPLLFYTGEKRWSTPIDLRHLMDLPAELERFVPRWETPFLNLHGTPPEALTRFASAIGWALRVMQAEKAPRADLERMLREAMAGLEELSAEQAGQWLRVAWFLVLLVMHRREEAELGELVVEQARQSKFGDRQEVTRMGLTIIEQAEARGEARGEARMLRSALERVLLRRFGELPGAVEAALAVADVATMNAWLDAAATAASLDEVGIRPPAPAPGAE